MEITKDEFNKLVILVPIVSVLVSGIFSILVTLVTQLLARRHDSKKETEKRSVERYNFHFELYAVIIQNFEIYLNRRIHLAEANDALDFSFLKDHAKLELLGNENILQNFVKTLNTLNVWKKIHYKSSPKRIEGSDTLMISSNDSQYDKAEIDARKIFQEGLLVLIKEMRKHLSEIRKQS